MCFIKRFSLSPHSRTHFERASRVISDAAGTYTCITDTGSSCSPQICVTLSVRLGPEYRLHSRDEPAEAPRIAGPRGWHREHGSERSQLCQDKQPLCTQRPGSAPGPAAACRGWRTCSGPELTCLGKTSPKAFSNHWESHPAACGQHQGGVPEAKPSRGLGGPEVTREGRGSFCHCLSDGPLWGLTETQWGRREESGSAI